jgi:hypothetical protein
MTDTQRIKYLQIALTGIGLIAIVGVYPLMLFWPSGWAWHTGYSDYPLMIAGIYATLGVFLVIASRHPLEHLSLIWFAVWSSVVHGAIMTVQALVAVDQHDHLLGDVPVLFLIAVVLAVLTPYGEKARSLRHGT